MGRGLFITGTDTDVGKTIATSILGLTLQDAGHSVGVMKPVQCSGDDTQVLKECLQSQDDNSSINPFYAKEPLSPHLALERSGQVFDKDVICQQYQDISDQHDVTLIEGAGGLLVPLVGNYLIADLIRDLNVPIIIVARLGLGTINHTLLTVQVARQYGLDIQGIIYNNISNDSGVASQTNPDEVTKISNVPNLGTIPFLKQTDRDYLRLNVLGCLDVNKISTTTHNKNSQVLKEADKKYVWHPFTQMKDWLDEDPVVIDRAEGSYLIDTDGKRYLDGVSSLWVNVHGHKHQRIDRAVKDQIDRLSHSTLLGLSNTPAVELAEQLVKISPEGLDKVFYSDNGSTAVEIAIKMAYQYWQNIGEANKTTIAHLSNSYHGDTLGSVSVGGIDLFHKVYKKLIFKTWKVDFPDCYRAPEGKFYPDYAFEYVDRFEKELQSKSDTVAALIVEPLMQGAAGMIMWPKGILKRLRDLCSKHNVLFIADEVATGFGRTGTMFACDQENVSPDFLCVAKGLTGGYLPLAATLTSQKIFDGFVHDYQDLKTFFHGHTYTGNPLCCSAALASLEVFAKEEVMKNLKPKINFLSQEMSMFYNLRSVGDVRQLGFMVGIELVQDKETKAPFPWEERVGVRVCELARKSGVMLRPLGNVIVLMPPLSIEKTELKKLLDVTYYVIATVMGDNFEI